MADPSIGDEVSLEPNGTVWLSLAGRPYRWRRPILGEFKKFEELWAEVTTQGQVVIDEANAIPEKERTGLWRLDWEAKHRDIAVQWVLDVWRILCEKDPPATDDCPPWMTNGAFHQLLKDHWTTVPLAASSR